MDLSGYSDEELAKIAAPQGPGPAGGTVPLWKAQNTLDVFAPQDPDLSHLSDDDLAQIAGGQPQTQPMPAAAPAQSNSFFGEMADNFTHGIQSGQDLLSGNFQDFGRVSPTPKTQALADKLFPPGSEGGIMDAANNAVSNTGPSDYAGALLEKFGVTPEGKALSALGGVNPVWNAASTAANRYVNPAIIDATRAQPESASGMAMHGVMGGFLPDSIFPKEGISPDTLTVMEMGLGAGGLKKAATISDPTLDLMRGIYKKMGAPNAPPAAEVRADASQKYQASEAAGGIAKPNITDAWINTATQVLPQTGAGKTILGETPVTKLVDRMQALRGQPLTLAEAQEIYSALGDMANSHVDPKTGKLLAEGKKFQDIQDSLWDTLDNASVNDMVGGKQGFDLWKQAKSEWAKSMRMGEVERIMNRANDSDNPVTVMKNGFRAMKDNPRRMRGFSEGEQAAIKQAAKTGVLTGALKLAGSRLISSVTGGAAGAVGGGPVGTVLGAGAGALVGTGFREAANSMQRGKAQKVLNTIYRGPQPSNFGASLNFNQLPSIGADAALGASITPDMLNDLARRFPVRQQ